MNTWEDKLAIQEVISKVTLNVDLRNVEKGYSFYTDDAVIDLTSLTGGVPLPAKQLLENSRPFRPAIDAYHHQVTNFDIEVEGDVARSISVMRAVQRIGDAIGEVGGVYYHDLVRLNVGWRIKHVRFSLSFKRGEDIMELAKQKIAQRA
jgi:hypothetical protein